VDQRLHYVKQEGQQVFKFAVRRMSEIASNLLTQHGLTADDVTWLIPHQANKRIINAVSERLALETR
jgi:3-oxoacyl-[acyl-carrier-protein] synthase-3